jgi:hypothetical protein
VSDLIAARVGCCSALFEMTIGGMTGPLGFPAVVTGEGARAHEDAAVVFRGIRILVHLGLLSAAEGFWHPCGRGEGR